MNGIVSSPIPKIDPPSEKMIIITGISQLLEERPRGQRRRDALDREVDRAGLLDHVERAADQKEESDDQRAVDEALDRGDHQPLGAEVDLGDLVISTGDRDLSAGALDALITA